MRDAAAIAVIRLARRGPLHRLSAGGYDYGMSNAADAVSRLSDEDRRPSERASTHRLITADELENEDRPDEASLLRDPGQHVVVVGGRVRPGRWNLAHLREAARAYYAAAYPPAQAAGHNYNPLWDRYNGIRDQSRLRIHSHTPHLSRNPAEQDTLFLDDDGVHYGSAVAPHLHLGPDGVPLGYTVDDYYGETVSPSPATLPEVRSQLGYAAERNRRLAVADGHIDPDAADALIDRIKTAPLETVDETHPLEVARNGHPALKPRPRPLPPAHGT